MKLNQVKDFLKTNGIEYEDIDVSLDKSKAQEMVDKSKKARTLLDAVASDGSWGVHNLKYTEMMLLRANQLINEAGEVK